MSHSKQLKIWYKQPAELWDEALPIGNGRLGGMVYGKIYSELIQLNEDSIWYGGPIDRNNPDAFANIQKIRQFIFDGKIREAENLATYALSGTPESARHYEPLGNLGIFFAGDKGEVENYTRELDISEGVTKVQFTLDGVLYQREMFVSYPNQVMVIHLTADQEGAISFHTQLSRGNTPWNDDPITTHKFRYNGGFNAYVDESYCMENDRAWMAGTCGGKNAISFGSLLKVQASGGTIKTLGNSVVVENANEATIYLCASTSFRESNFKEFCVKKIEKAVQLGYQIIRKMHVEDYCNLFNRVSIDVNKKVPENVDLTTDERLKQIMDGNIDYGMINLFYQYGRYLLISSSREGSLPANLQGIWNQDMLPIWDSKYTININTQMNYWLAESCNLSECHLPLFELIERMRVNGRNTAKKMYGCNGFMAHHNTDIWADTAPQDVCVSSTYWVMGAAWLCLHLWEHFQFSQDIEFLKNSYETMREAATFLVEFMIEDMDGKLIICPSISPENEYVLASGETGVLCKGASMDSQIIYALFTACIKSATLLNIDKEFQGKLEEILKQIPKPEIGKYGQIMEWAQDYEEVDPGHRHISHLFALHPGNQISMIKSPELAEAAKKTLERRLSKGGGHTGWSRAWIINMWARLGDGEQAFTNILELLRKSTLPNLFDNHPPFQIDGNFGCTAGIAEMLLQSQNDELHILPALPNEWESGHIKGIRARGGYTLDIIWEDGNLEIARIYASMNGVINLRYKDNIKVLTVEKGQTYLVDFN